MSIPLLTRGAFCIMATSAPAGMRDPVWLKFAEELKSKLLIWLYQHRTLEQIYEMEHRECTCPLSDRTDFHDTAEKLVKQYGHRWPCTIYLGVPSRIIRQAIGKDTVRNLHKRKYWPTSVAKILPFGPGDSMRNLLRWLDVDWGKAFVEPILGTVNDIYVLCHTVLLPHILTSRLLIRRGILQVLEGGYTILVNDCKFQQMLSGENQTEDLLRGCSTIMIDTILYWGDGIQLQVFLGEHATQFIRVYDRICSFLIATKKSISRRSADFDRITDLLERLVFVSSICIIISL